MSPLYSLTSRCYVSSAYVTAALKIQSVTRELSRPWGARRRRVLARFVLVNDRFRCAFRSLCSVCRHVRVPDERPTARGENSFRYNNDAYRSKSEHNVARRRQGDPVRQSCWTSLLEWCTAFALATCIHGSLL